MQCNFCNIILITWCVILLLWTTTPWLIDPDYTTKTLNTTILFSGWSRNLQKVCTDWLLWRRGTLQSVIPYIINQIFPTKLWGGACPIPPTFASAISILHQDFIHIVLFFYFNQENIKRLIWSRCNTEVTVD